MVLAVLLVAANVAGLLRYPGGPLREPNADGLLWLDHRPDDQGNNRIEISPPAGVPIYVGIDPRNAWPWYATIEQVRLISATPGLELIEGRLAHPGASADGLVIASGSGPELEALRLYTDYEPLPGNLAGDTPIGDGRMWLEVIASEPGEYSFESVALDYRIGPFSFTIVIHQALTACVVPLPEGTICSIEAK